ncbi:SDR family oxidoreductase [Umezawaea tangerina]|uniref:NAD(P)-dependent dehydrogenase (Short-subunit alcohol dehydrogenase family) n=1 Tax=Umezawaea tangerina TaxID=84725 RepID=A0A2T0SR10_9PSEU|nr:SDR family oxidoreductase [Umezawaea tangerina]PRY35852.1 NAD(P)-dependent dehydrogenase (short-subunit alcohol dehydrogenase family) [Umezawaea tangerina]
MSQVTVVTGGSRGIGAATVRRLAAQGHHLAIGYRQAKSEADALVADITAAGGRAVAVRVDTTSPDDVDALFDTATTALGPITGLVNNAGVTSPAGDLADLHVDDLRRVLDVNLLGAFLCARRASRDLTEGGAIVNVSSAAATLGSPGEYVHYAAAKAGVDALTIGLAKELGPRGIRVNCVAPGTIRTDIHTTSGLPDRPDRMATVIPLRRAGEPDDIAAAITWLLGPDATFTTGAILRVAGGL